MKKRTQKKREQEARWYVANKEKAREYNRKYRAANKDRIREQRIYVSKGS